MTGENRYKTSPGDLFKAWSISRSAGQARQISIRIPATTFYRINAIEELFPERSRNEIIADLLSTAIDQFEESLPSEYAPVSNEPIGRDEDGNPVYEEKDYGPKGKFLAAYKRIKQEAEIEANTDNVTNIEEAAE